MDTRHPRALVPRFAIPDTSPWALEVIDIEPVTPSVKRLRLRLGRPEAGRGASGEGEPEAESREGGASGGRALEGGVFSYAPGQDISLSLPGPGGSPVNRRYTISHYDPAESVVTLEVVSDGDGPGARWIRSAGPGERVAAVGPRGKITVVDGVVTHLLVGDEASLAAIAALLQALRPPDRAVVVADVAGLPEHREVAAPAGVELELHWLDRGDAPPEAPDRVLGALDALQLAATDTFAYVFGEFHVVAAARLSLAERLDPARISAKAYWRAGRENASHGEPVRDP